jgi:hypothetical protein
MKNDPPGHGEPPRRYARRPRWHFDARAALWALGLFALLVLLATLGARAGWVRGFLGDVLAVAWLYYLFRTVLEAKPLPLALAALGIGCALEAAQYLARLWHLRIANPVLRAVVGSTPDWMDVLAYAIGFAGVLWLETRRCGRRASRSPSAS